MELLDTNVLGIQPHRDHQTNGCDACARDVFKIAIQGRLRCITGDACQIRRLCTLARGEKVLSPDRQIEDHGRYSGDVIKMLNRESC